jgi:threonine/homoserine/homoserine lactone efflux protein
LAGGERVTLYILASLALILTPGQDMMYVMSRALAQGRLAGVYSAVGVIIGILVHTVLAALGVGAILAASEGLFLALKLLGAAYLVYLGARLILTREASIAAQANGQRFSPASLLWQGVLSNVSNPKIVVFFFAFLPQFVDPKSPHPTADLILLGVLYAAMGLVVKVGVGLAAGSLSERLLGKPRALVWINRVSGTILVGLGLRLAGSQR